MRADKLRKLVALSHQRTLRGGIMIRLLIVALALVSCMASTASARGHSQKVREAAKVLVKRYGKEVAGHGVEGLRAKIARYGTRYGDDAVGAIKRVGPRGFELLDAAGPDAPRVARLLHRYGNDALGIAARPQKVSLYVRYGDEAAEAMIKHPGAAEPVINAFGHSAPGALRAVSPQNGRRLAMMAHDGSLAASGSGPALLKVIGKYGDRGAEFVWKNKGALAVGAVALAFVTDPEPFIVGTRDLAEIAELPAHSMAQEIGRSIAQDTDWTMVISLLMVLLVGLLMRRWVVSCSKRLLPLLDRLARPRRSSSASTPPAQDRQTR